MKRSFAAAVFAAIALLSRPLSAQWPLYLKRVKVQ